MKVDMCLVECMLEVRFCVLMVCGGLWYSVYFDVTPVRKGLSTTAKGPFLAFDCEYTHFAIGATWRKLSRADLSTSTTGCRAGVFRLRGV